MNKKLVLAAALVFGVAGLILAQGSVKAEDTNAAMNADNTAMNAENAAMNADTAMNADNAAMNADNAAK